MHTSFYEIPITDAFLKKFQIGTGNTQIAGIESIVNLETKRAETFVLALRNTIFECLMKSFIQYSYIIIELTVEVCIESSFVVSVQKIFGRTYGIREEYLRQIICCTHCQKHVVGKNLTFHSLVIGNFGNNSLPIFLVSQKREFVCSFSEKQILICKHYCSECCNTKRRCGTGNPSCCFLF